MTTTRTPVDVEALYEHTAGISPMSHDEILSLCSEVISRRSRDAAVAELEKAVESALLCWNLENERANLAAALAAYRGGAPE